MKVLPFLIIFILFTNPVRADVVINEIMYNPTSTLGGTSNEWIELYNPSNETINLTGWILKDYGSTNTSLSGTLQPNSYLIIADNATNFNETYNCSCFVIDGSLGLSNSGDRIWIWNASVYEIDSLTYDDSWGADGNNRTLERIDPFGISNTSTNWAESTINGTSGQRNSATPEEHDLAVYSNNITFAPLDPSPRTGVNITVTIRNLGLFNETNVNASVYNSSTLIDSRLLNITKQSAINFTIVWNNTATDNHTILVSISNVTGETNMTNSNATNNISVKFRLVINEIMYNPPAEIGSDVDFEWVEIYNNASYNENLTGWFLKCDTETSNPKTKTLSGNLESGKHFVLAKDVTQFYTYYSSSIQTDSQTCSLNNDDEAVKLIFNDSNIYYEESVTYSNSWGADGTGYSLERTNPNSTSWAESIAYGGTPGAKNNPDNRTKSSLKQTEVVYRTTSSGGGGGSIVSSTTKESDYEIISHPTVVYIGQEFEIVVSLKSDTKKNLTVYSYVFDGRKLLSEGFDGTKWRKTWTANEKSLILNAGSTATLTLKNRIRDDASPGDYKLRVRIVDEKDLTKDIKVTLPPESTLPIIMLNCNVNNEKIFVDMVSNIESNVTLLIFSERGMEIKNITVLNETREIITPIFGYYYIVLTQDKTILDKCSFNIEKSMSITGKATETTNFIFRFYTWLKSILTFL